MPDALVAWWLKMRVGFWESLRGNGDGYDGRFWWTCGTCALSPKTEGPTSIIETLFTFNGRLDIHQRQRPHFNEGDTRIMSFPVVTSTVRTP